MIANDQFDDKELHALLRELRIIVRANIPGDIVELGCYKGLTSLRIQHVLQEYAVSKRLYIYDSFNGLPDKTANDVSPAGEQFKAGELPAQKKDVIKLFKQSSIPVPFIKKAWFNELVPDDLPALISFAFLDGDFYESVMDSLKLVWPKLSKGAVVVVDDYQNEALPGAQKAVDDWLKTHSAHLKVEASLAIITQST